MLTAFFDEMRQQIEAVGGTVEKYAGDAIMAVFGVPIVHEDDAERSAREGFPVFVADRLEAVKWRNWKFTFYESERDWWSPPIRLGVPKIFDLVNIPKRNTRRPRLRTDGSPSR